MKTALEWKKYYSSPEFREHYIYDNDDLGVSCTDSGTSFKLWSPSADSVTLNLYHEGDGGAAYAHIPMKKEDQGVWSSFFDENLYGVYYDYSLMFGEENVRSADPYAYACGVNGRRSMAVDLKMTDPEGWENDRAPEKGTEQIIYELHVKEFSWDPSGGFPEQYRGKYKAFTCPDTTLYGDGIHPTGMRYMKDLGITHVQIMPAYDYGSVNEAGKDTEFNWGYDPVNYNVPEGSYSTDPAHGEVRIREMKEMIQVLHSQGFRVIMDVVYNHTYSLDSWFQRTAPWYFYRVFDNGRISNGSACGNDVASEREMCAKYILESVLYWTEEYHIDGFRFDLMGLMDVDLMNRIRKALDERYGRGEKLLFGEPWAAAETAMERGAIPALKKNIALLDENIGMFCDDTRDAVKGSALKIKRPGFINGAAGKEMDIVRSARAWCASEEDSGRDEEAAAGVRAPSQIITYVSAHDNQTLWDKLAETMPEADAAERMRLNRMAAALYMTCQGTLFLLSGEEFARTKNGLEDSFNAPIALNRLDWKTFERGQENCYLMTNGFGGFSSLTMTGSAARNDHALFMACMKAPNNRYNMVHRLSERVEISGESYTLSSQEFADGSREDGYRYLAEFAYEDTPVWKFLVKGVQIDKEAALGQEVNTAVVRYRIRNRSRKDIRLIVTPFYQFTPKGEDPEADRRFRFCGDRIESEGLSLYFRTDGDTEVIPELSETYHYAYDACDGRRSTGLAKACHQISLEVKSGDSASLAIVYSTENGGIGEQEDAGSLAESVIREMKEHRNALVKKAGFCDETAAFLVKSARQFVSRRESTGGKTILAGFPFFEDWGRDTMIALPGVCISTGQYEDAESILRTFAKYERNGLMPNLFPEGKNEPMYNTADAALLFVNCVWLLFRATGNAEFVKEMYPVMERIIDYYQSGTDYNIHMDADGLIAAGSGLDQVTWMDVRAGDILPTPRHGKPVEINAYWYNALRIMGEFSRLLAGADTSEGCRAENVPYHSGEERYSRRSEQYDRMAEQAAKAFRDKFWMEEDHCLKDVVSGTKADRQIRCNQIWAVSMPFTMLDADKERQVVETVFEKLYTPYGLRTLDEEDAEFRPFYGGDVLERDLAYHQGTVWAYPLGAYYLAYLKVNRYSAQAKEEVRSQMEVLESALREGCIGQLPEIYDGADPVSSKGCFAQAWSVGEMLRVYEALEDKHAL